MTPTRTCRIRTPTRPTASRQRSLLPVVHRGRQIRRPSAAARRGKSEPAALPLAHAGLQTRTVSQAGSPDDEPLSTTLPARELAILFVAKQWRRWWAPRRHGRDRDREQQGLHAVHPAHAARPAAAPGPPARGRAPARAAARRRGALRRRRRERRRPDRHPPRRRPRARVRPAVLRAARLRLRAPAEDPQGRPQPAAEPLPVPDGRRRRTPSRPPGSRWPSTRP